jgi:hypothetical protein
LAEGAANFFFQDWKFSITPGVPINSSAIDKLMARDFAEPTPFPLTISVAVESKEVSRSGNLQLRGNPCIVHRDPKVGIQPLDVLTHIGRHRRTRCRPMRRPNINCGNL